MKATVKQDDNTIMDERSEYRLYHIASTGKRTPEFHSHDFYEIYFFISGDVSAYIEEYAYRLRPGDVIIFPPERLHRAFFHNSDVLYERMILYVQREALSRMGQSDYNLLGMLDACMARAQFCHALTDQDLETCKYLFSDVIANIDDDSAHQRMLTRCKVTMLLTHVCKWFSESPDEPSSRAGTRMANIIAYINEHISEDLSLDGISAKFFISKYHLIREFKAYANRTVYQYILSKRIILAKQYMQSGASPTDVYLKCGFHDYSSFYKVFKKETGLSPQQYIGARAAELS